MAVDGARKATKITQQKSTKIAAAKSQKFSTLSALIDSSDVSSDGEEEDLEEQIEPVKSKKAKAISTTKSKKEAAAKSVRKPSKLAATTEAIDSEDDVPEKENRQGENCYNFRIQIESCLVIIFYSSVFCVTQGKDTVSHFNTPYICHQQDQWSENCLRC